MVAPFLYLSSISTLIYYRVKWPKIGCKESHQK